MELTDRFVVLRNGKVHGAGRTAEARKSDIVRMIIGRDVTARAKAANVIAAKPVLKVENLRSGRLLRDVGFELHHGEILGVWGLMGSGRTELLRAILGLDAIDGGRVLMAESGALRPVAPGEVLARSGYVTESRHTDGLFLAQPVWKNVTATTLRDYASKVFRFLDTREEIATAIRYIDTLKIKTPGPSVPAEKLSGGNQQKVVFAKWLNKRPPILLLDEPTRGVDVGAKFEIHGLIAELAREGTSVILVSSEIEEVVALSDRVLVLRDGHIAASATGDGINNAALMAMALGEERLHA
jgi:ribose transport system ATP-binding protein